MKKFVHLAMLLLAGLPFSAQAQVTNGNTVNYQVRTSSLYYEYDCWDGTDYPTFLIKTATDLDNQQTWLMNFSWNQSSGQDHCLYWNADVPSTSNQTQTLRTQSGVSNAKYDIECQAFNDNESMGTRCIGETGGIFYSDDCGWVRSGALHDGKYSSACQWNNQTLTYSGYLTLTTQTAWRYEHGSWGGDPLTFGTIGAGQTKTHTNSNRAAPSGASSSTGYSNYWHPGWWSNSTDAPDVTYQFTISGNAKKVTISTDYAETNYDTKIHLIRAYSGGGLGNIAYNDDIGGGNLKSRIVADLGPGDYLVVVEGYGTNTGDFKLTVNAVDATVNPGSITQPSPNNYCLNADLPQIPSSAVAAAGESTNHNLGSVAYEWEKRLAGGSWTPISGSNTADLSQSNSGSMGNETIYFRRKATLGGNVAYSNEVNFTLQASTIYPGSIELTAGSVDVVPSGTSPGYMDSTFDGSSYDDATGSPLPISYEWEYSTNDGASWTAIANSDSYDYYIPELTETTIYRRRAFNGCDGNDLTNEIEITVLQPDGSISGRVTSPAGPGGPGGGVEGVTVTAERTTAVTGGNIGEQYTATTDVNGNYTITDIYYGETSAQFTITPSKVDGGITHVFSPASLTGQTISSTFKNLENKDFVDETTFNFEGNVYQRFNNNPDPNGTPDYVDCGMGLVEIRLNNIPKDTTDSDGNYAISISSIGTYTISAHYNGHSFSPAAYTDMYIDSDNTGMDFENTQTYTVDGFVGGSCDAIIGRASLVFTSLDNCISRTLTTNTDGTYAVELPAREYTVQLTEFDENNDGQTTTPLELAVQAFFGASLEVDLSDGDQNMDLIYRRPPVMRITGLPAEVCGETTVLEQLEPYVLNIEIFEGVLDGCPVDTGRLLITDVVGDVDEPVELPFANGTASYTLLPGEPNIVAPYLKNLSITAQDTMNQFDTFALDALVTGVRPREQTFTTVTPEVPVMILRDPPGDMSYSYVTQSQVNENAVSFYNLDAGSINTWTKVKLGVKYEAGIGFSVESKFWGQVGLAVNVGATNKTTDESIMTVQTTETFSTSGNPNVIGTEGDVFIGAAMNMLYALADIVSYDEGTCTASTDIDLVIANDGFATNYIYTESYIRNTTIPQLNLLASLTANPDSAAWYLDQANVWQQALLQNEELKANAVFQENKSFSGALSYNNSTTTTSTGKTSIQFNTEIDEEVAAELGMEVGGSGLSGGVTAKFKLETGKLTTTTTTQSFTTGFHLEDNDPGDAFTVNIKTDPVYKTPVFDLVSGITSCPYEEGTQHRYGAQLTAVNPVVTNIDPNSVGAFTLQLKNVSESGETGSYTLAFNQASNPDGAAITVGGSPYVGPITYTIPYLSTINVAVTVGRGASNVYSYEGLEFNMFPACAGMPDYPMSESTAISAFFDSPCSDVSMFKPTEGWTINASSQTLTVHAKDYDKSQMDQLQVQYLPLGSGSWSNLLSINAAALNDNNPGGSNLGHVATIDMGNIPDGEYDIRLKLVCGSNSVYSGRARGTVDKTPPSVMGIPRPTDGYWEVGDEISAEFNEAIKCNSASAVLVDVNTGEVYPASIGCYGNKASITPGVDLSSLGDVLLKVQLNGIADMAGNGTNVSWLFGLGNYEPPAGCPPIHLVNNNATYNALTSGVYSGGSVQTSATVSPTTDVDVYGATYVLMEEGFTAMPGSFFTAEIAACGGTPPLAAQFGEPEGPLAEAAVEEGEPKSGEAFKAAVMSGDKINGGEPSMRVIPNPFHQVAAITFGLPEDAEVSLAIYDLTGRKVATLLTNESRAAGSYSVGFDASLLPGGVYIAKLQAGGQTHSIRLVKGM